MRRPRSAARQDPAAFDISNQACYSGRMIVLITGDRDWGDRTVPGTADPDERRNTDERMVIRKASSEGLLENDRPAWYKQYTKER